tara:strand:- start:210 stop:836 length:627 start_codon:yes stop_codon:yes gene_type:complete
VTRWARSVAHLNQSPSPPTRRWRGLTTPQELPKDGSPFAVNPDTIKQVGFLARWVWLPVVATALLVVVGHGKATEPSLEWMPPVGVVYTRPGQIAEFAIEVKLLRPDCRVSVDVPSPLILLMDGYAPIKIWDHTPSRVRAATSSTLANPKFITRFVVPTQAPIGAGVVYGVHIRDCGRGITETVESPRYPIVISPAAEAVNADYYSHT